MKKKLLRIIALVVVCTLLAGCGLDADLVKDSLGTKIPIYAEMEYSRPDMDALEAALAEATEAAAGEDFDRIIDQIWAFYDVYDRFYTDYALADIRYSGDLTDSYWEEEYNFCIENSPRVDAMLEELYYALAKSPCLAQLESDDYFGAGFFDSYQGENNWDEEFTALMEQESELISRYYEFSGNGSAYEMGTEAYYNACYRDMAQVLVDLIRLRQEIAAYWGYDSYPEFAAAYYHYRDYSVAESKIYLEEIREELVNLYRQVNLSGIWDDSYGYATEEQTYAYVEEMAKNMGGMAWEAFQVMDVGGLYDIRYGENKYPASFEIYLDSYYVPFIFLDPTLTTYDQLSFAHEFGHFCNDYASGYSYAGVDVLEIFSQGMEYLSLCYVEDTEHLTKLKMADSLSLFVEQSAFASFEMQMYEIPLEELTVEALEELYDRVAREYGFESIGYDPREFITINHYYTNPMYIISYVVSNDAAMQLYQMERSVPGSGLAVLEAHLTTEEYYFLSFLSQAGLESPFGEGRIRQVRETFEAILK